MYAKSKDGFFKPKFYRIDFFVRKLKLYTSGKSYEKRDRGKQNTELFILNECF